MVGVTGSKGKSTTSTLIHEILKAGDKKSLLVGNIGEPAIEHVKDMDSNTARGEPQRTIFVLEMSSYQLMDCRSSPPIAVITTFFPEHLDYHASTGLSTGSTPLETYKGAKMNITRHQSEEDFVIFDGLSQGAKEIAMESAEAHRRTCGGFACGIDGTEGRTQRRNAAIAFLTTRLLGP